MINEPIQTVDDLEIDNYRRTHKALIKDIKGLIRKIKIDSILEDKRSFSKDNVPKRIKTLIDKYSYLGVITGSTLLSMYGFTKKVGDLDLIVNTKNYEIIKNKYKVYNKDFYNNETKEYMGVLKDGDYKIDIFLDDTVTGEEKDGILIDSLSRTLTKKLELYEKEKRGKDFHNFHVILKCIKDNIYITHQKNFHVFENFKNFFFSKS
jgi:hypothetical protein